MSAAEVPSLKRSTRKLLSLFLASALVAAQALALAHGAVHLQPRSDPLGAPPAHAQPCGACLSFAPLHAAAQAPAQACALLDAAMESPGRAAPAAAAGRSCHPPFRSRAPPRSN